MGTLMLSEGVGGRRKTVLMECSEDKAKKDGFTQEARGTVIFG